MTNNQMDNAMYAYDNNAYSASKKSKRKSIVGKIVIYIVLVLYAALIIFPFSIVIITSFKTSLDAHSLTFKFFPDDGYTIEGYIDVFGYKANMDAPMPTLVQGFLNTFIYVIPPTVLGLFTSSLSAYDFVLKTLCMVSYLQR